MSFETSKKSSKDKVFCKLQGCPIKILIGQSFNSPFETIKIDTVEEKCVKKSFLSGDKILHISYVILSQSNIETWKKVQGLCES